MNIDEGEAVVGLIDVGLLPGLGDLGIDGEVGVLSNDDGGRGSGSGGRRGTLPFFDELFLPDVVEKIFHVTERDGGEGEVSEQAEHENGNEGEQNGVEEEVKPE